MIDPVDLTQKLVRCRSITPEDDGALATLAAPLEACGFQIHWLPFEEVGAAPVSNFFAQFGESGKHLCYLGHTDVVPVGTEKDWTHPPFEADIVDGILYGRGAADMKSGNAAFVAAAERFIRTYPDFGGSISLLITGDEEGVGINGTEKIVKWMVTENRLPDVALVGEPGNPERMGQLVRVGRRGSWNGILSVDGVQGHSAYPERADNPVPKLVDLLHILTHHELDQGNEFFPKSHMVVASVDVGNTAHNIIPAHATALLNVRFNDMWTAQTLEDHIRSLLDRAGISYSLKGWSNSASFLVKDTGWRDMVAEAVREVSGTAPEFSTGGGTSDARFIAPFCPVVEYGVVNESIHKVDEHVRVDDILTLTETYFRILKKYFL